MYQNIKYIRAQYKVLILFAFIISAGLFLTVNKVEAAAGDIVVTVNDQFGSPYGDGSTPAARIACPGGTAYEVIDGSGADGDGLGNFVIVFTAATIGNGTTAECDNGEAFTVEEVEQDGLIGVNTTSLTTYSTAIQNDTTVNLLYAHKLIVVDELGNSLTPTDVHVGSDEFPCFTFLDGAAYCALETYRDDTASDGYSVTKDGYVTNFYEDVPLAGNRVNLDDPQVVTTMTVTNGLKFSHKITDMKDEIGGSLTVDWAIGGGSSVNCSVSGTAVYCPIALADDNGGLNVEIGKDGYRVSAPNTFAGNRTSNSDAQLVHTLAVQDYLPFAHKLVLKDELNQNVTPTSVTAGANDVICSIVANIAYCPVLVADDDVLTDGYVVNKDGYVQLSVDFPEERNNDYMTQEEVDLDASNGIKFAYKLTTIRSEVFNTNLTATASAVSVGDDTGRNACTLSGGAWYCPVTLANSNGTMIARVTPPDGYVDAADYALVTGTNRLLATTAQISDTVTNVRYAVKVTVKLIDSTMIISGATVVTGDNGAVSCTESGSTGTYYCVVPLAHTDSTVYAVKTGYVAGINNFTERTLATMPQEALVVYMNTNSSGGGGGGIFSNNTATNITPAANVPHTENLNIVDRLNQEKDIILTQSNPESYFINTGTDSTLGLGSGERGAAVSSFKEAYGKSPITAADWIDVLNIANGRWPITVNKTVEARAYLNFRAVYGRNADMTNSTDVNALKMMGYGVMKLGARDFMIERFAIGRFITIFGFAPSTARHWNIMRAIAYSGVVK